MKILKKIITTFFNIITILIVILVIVVIYNFIQVNFLKKKYPEILGYTFFEVKTGSMADTIQVNDFILVKLTDEEQKNDIISYINENEIITHRIIEQKEGVLITKGDANNAIDIPIQKSSVIGKVVKIFPKMGIWIKVLSDIKVDISIIVTLILLGLIFTKKNNKKNRHSFSKFMKNMRRSLKDAKEKKAKD